MKSSTLVESFFDPVTSTISYIVVDRDSGRGAIVDSVLDYDPKSGRTSTRSADVLLNRVRELGVAIDWHLETHVHADHLSGAAYLHRHLGGKIAIGEHIRTVQRNFGELFNVGPEFKRDGSQFDVLFSDGEIFEIGNIRARAMHTPGHTPACMTYVMEEDAPPAFAFVGDTLFMPDYGTARCDFPGGDARTLFQSIRKLLTLPDDTVLYMCHDYRPGGRELKIQTTVGAERTSNIHVHEGIAEDVFVDMRQARDATLEMPVLILPSVQINMRAGGLPEPESNGTRYLKIPLDVL